MKGVEGGGGGGGVRAEGIEEDGVSRERPRCLAAVEKAFFF